MTLDELRADRNLTPERFMKYFADFRFQLGRDVREPEVFLASQSGDCDDFATLAASVLREKGYSTRLVVVYMPNDVHVVCYVAETHGYLDYNCRKQTAPLVKSEGALEAIAARVAESFRAQWRSVSEFTFVIMSCSVSSASTTAFVTSSMLDSDMPSSSIDRRRST